MNITQVRDKGALCERTYVRLLSEGSVVFSTEGLDNVRDFQSHLDAAIEGVTRVAASHPVGTLAVIAECVWQSAYGHGGPTIGPQQLARLAELGITCRLVFIPGELVDPDDPAWID